MNQPGTLFLLIILVGTTVFFILAYSKDVKKWNRRRKLRKTPIGRLTLAIEEVAESYTALVMPAMYGLINTLNELYKAYEVRDDEQQH